MSDRILAWVLSERINLARSTQQKRTSDFAWRCDGLQFVRPNNTQAYFGGST